MKRTTAFLIVAIALAFSGSAYSQSSVSNSTVLMKILDSAGDMMEGEVTQAGREGLHRLLAYSHEIISPRDPASGLPTGKRQHKPFRLVKLVNKSSPLLLTSMTKNEKLDSVEVMIWSQQNTGAELKVLTYRLTDATVVGIRPWMPNKADPATVFYPPAEEVTFVYQTIEVIFHNGNVVGSDDWPTP